MSKKNKYYVCLVSGDYESSSSDDEKVVNATTDGKTKEEKEENTIKTASFGLTGDDVDVRSSSSLEGNTETSSSEESEGSPVNEVDCCQQALPNFLTQPEQTSNSGTSVFSNSYKEREIATTSILEQHVKMTDTLKKSNFDSLNKTKTNKRKHWKGKRRNVEEDNNSDDDQDASRKRHKLRVGITDNIVPPKRALEQLHRIRAAERSWTQNVNKKG